jgi:alpha-tubulin suppressor-like RCC1 family protein
LIVTAAARAKVGFGLGLGVILVFAGAATASAAVLPDDGPTKGGTSVQVPADRAVSYTDVSAGTYHTVAIASDGDAYSWGNNAHGALGDGTTTDSPVPVRVQAPSGVTFTHVAASDFATVGVGSDGKAYGWGLNQFGQLGDGTTTDSSVPVRVHAPVGVTFTQIAAGTYSVVAVGSDGNAYSWGDNSYGGLGDGTTTASLTPVRVHAPSGVTFTQVAAGTFHTIAIGSDGNTYTWGNNIYGQLGTGTTANSPVPVRVLTPRGVTFTQVAAGAYHSAAVASDGNTYTWGNNPYGQLGDGTTTSSSVPVLVRAPPGVTLTQVAAGAYETVGVGSDGDAYAWGNNAAGELGDGTTTDSSVPVQIGRPTGATFTEVAAGTSYTVAIGSDGNGYAWGSNSLGQLGDGTTVDSSLPVQVAAALSVVAVTFDGAHGVITGQTGEAVTVRTPPHASGAVDVLLTWSDGLVETVPGGFTFGAAPEVTLSPASGSIPKGRAVVLTAAATGDEIPSVHWQVSTDNGHTWSDVAGATTPSVSVTAGGQYRAVFHNTLGTATTRTASLVAAGAAPPPPASAPTAPGASTPSRPNPPSPISSTPNPPTLSTAPVVPGALAFTGSEVAPLLLGALVLLLLGGGFLTLWALRSRKRREDETPARSA